MFLCSDDSDKLCLASSMALTAVIFVGYQDDLDDLRRSLSLFESST